MVVVLTVLFVASALLLCVLILIQDDQGEGVGGMFGGGSSTAFGSRSGNILTRSTTILAVVFLSTALGVAWLNRSPATDDIEARARVRRLQETQGGWFAPTRSDEASDSDVSSAESENQPPAVTDGSEPAEAAPASDEAEAGQPAGSGQ